jgi:MYXO-CTERM domain-containing protein
MRSMMLPTLFAATLISPLAFAGGETDTGTDTGTTDGGTEESTDESTDESSDEGSGECGSCTEAEEVAWITAPTDGAMVESPFEVTIDSTYYCYCDDCGCNTATFSQVTIQADGVQVAAGQVGSFQLELEPGVHTLTVSAIDPDYLDAITTSAPITVTVIGDGGSTTDDDDDDDDDGGSGLTADGGESDESGGGMADDQAAEGGCSCTATPSPMPIGAGLALLGLLALRRRRP